MNVIPKVSIIIPVYNVEQFIERCVRSLFEQSFENIEYVFVDDCSPDKSIQILKAIINEYPQRLENIKIIQHKINKGISFTRNTGLENATGEYIIHVDSDDWVESSMIEELYSEAIKNNSEMVWSDFYVDYPNSQKEVHYQSQNLAENSKCCINAIFKGEMHGGLWNKLIKRNLILNHNIRFPEEVNMCEDQYFVILCLLKTNRINYYPKAFYHYVQNDTSLTLARTRQSFESEIIGIKLLEQIPQDIYGESLNLYKACVKSGIFMSGMYTNDEFVKCFPESNSNVVVSTSGRVNKFAIKLALYNMFILARFVISIGGLISKFNSYKLKK